MGAVSLSESVFRVIKRQDTDRITGNSNKTTAEYSSNVFLVLIIPPPMNLSDLFSVKQYHKSVKHTTFASRIGIARHKVFCLLRFYMFVCYNGQKQIE